MKEDKAKDDEEVGILHCVLCNAKADVDPNDVDAVMDWYTKHIFGHSGQE